MDCHVAHQYRQIIAAAERVGDMQKANTFSAMLYRHEQDCDQCNPVRQEPAVKWKQGVWVVRK